MAPRRSLGILALGVALLPAPSASGQGCPRRFTAVTTGLPTACLFAGQLRPGEDKPVLAAFAGDGVVLVVSLMPGNGAPPLLFPARVTTGTKAELVRWRPDLDLGASRPRGAVRLDPQGETLSLQVGPVPDDDGATLEFRGRFVGMAAVPLAVGE